MKIILRSRPLVVLEWERAWLRQAEGVALWMSARVRGLPGDEAVDGKIPGAITGLVNRNKRVIDFHERPRR